MYKHILVPVDGSDHARQAVQAARSLAENQGGDARLTILYVHPVISVNEAAMIDLDALIEAESASILEDTRRQLEGTSVAFDLQKEHGDPAYTICRFAKEGGYELIAMGSRGLGLFSELFLGSVSHKVSQQSHCPVLIVK
ncbi:universal stress protein YxiE [Paenibacillus sp. J31TS4]|uniref:universal stress protein n=1 Tax=Paenibacillus sp. J31TS4 TaxID=2807195 RepID=UPI001B029215|nr:universal stress protein [Paenibacillus sp. J31TS4]GIP40451.1 universal stress protein YxiE [Paenibacillus sp. J31TS4]